MANLLIEILTEELPTKAVADLSFAGADIWKNLCQEYALNIASIDTFQTPRRLAWRLNNIDTQQENQIIKRRGVNLANAKDKDGNWTKAALGFAASCGVSVEKLQIENNYLMFISEQQGKTLAALLPDIFQRLLDSLPIAKRMRWGDLDQSFVRPVLGLVALLDAEILPLTAFGITANNQTLGHRIHSHGFVTIPHANDYEKVLRAASVIPTIDERKSSICEQIAVKEDALNLRVQIDDDLLQEVASLVEFPVVIMGNFEEKFLEIPPETLITTMTDNQKCFPVFDMSGSMKNYFIAVANLRSEDESLVIKGNEKVIRPRFADAQFFWHQDLKHRLEDYLPRLEKVSYQAKLGTLADKTRRLQTLVQSDDAKAAAQIALCDLLTFMVMEFPELQGIMGKYYALKQGINENIAFAIEEQYFPIGAGGKLPVHSAGLELALAQKVDTLVGGFAVGAKPTGSKDPYALRRNAIGLIRLIIEKELTLDLPEYLKRSAALFSAELNAVNFVPEIIDYLIERLENYFREQNIKIEIYQAIKTLNLTDILDFNCRVLALNKFVNNHNATSLLASAKRIRNILKKNGEEELPVNLELLTEPAEKELHEKIIQQTNKFNQELAARNYLNALIILSDLSETLDNFFKNVMVMVEDKSLQKNRLALLTILQKRFESIADLSLI